ncbi:aminotransferase class I/II-fold pyridoxal phosphate-dependent enzyme [Streptomyces echinatus]|uniref:Aspartate/methionine/tyrosine aminotransferase n=1 Tax=Streptomyces echinatus TaxID=67293 RepID=A0A7W9UQ54_9ACTN|nr:aminotransferase class I/II-fold pyridoxal phosphate-dependent enzyme [Streptomyces echinatus]MBB5926581.1 aspartate/methionine/tyrosine aminotransferase [Streptomyces echinatus]
MSLPSSSPHTSDDRDLLYSELAAHDRLGEVLEKEPERTFVSDWNGEHPFARSFLGELADVPVGALGALGTYSHMDEDTELAAAVADLHVRRYGEPSVTARRCVPGAGATSFLTTLLLYQFLDGVRELAYLPPVYYNAGWWIRRLGFTVHRVAPDVDFVEDVPLRLPTGRCLLWLTDPVWFAGVPVGRATLDAIRDWQCRTGSTVIVDGTFQYMGWDGAGPEATEWLDPDLTFRLVCPTKTLALHGFRFAYALVPERCATAFAELHGRLHGAAGLADRRFAHRAVAVLGAGDGALPLMRFAEARYRRLRAGGALPDAVEPVGGYFVFGRPEVAAHRIAGMDIACFGGSGHPGFVRVNLLNPSAVECLSAAIRSRDGKQPLDYG